MNCLLCSCDVLVYSSRLYQKNCTLWFSFLFFSEKIELLEDEQHGYGCACSQGFSCLFFLGSVSCCFNGLLSLSWSWRVGRHRQGAPATQWRVTGKKTPLPFSRDGCVAGGAGSSVTGGGKLSPVTLLNVMPCYFWSRETKQPEGSRCCSSMDCEEQHGQGVRGGGGIEQTAVPGVAPGEPLEAQLRSLQSPSQPTPSKTSVARCQQWYLARNASACGGCTGSVCAVVRSPWLRPCSCRHPMPLQLFLGSLCRQLHRQLQSASLCTSSSSGETGTQKFLLLRRPRRQLLPQPRAESPTARAALGPQRVARDPLGELHYLQLAAAVLTAVPVRTVVVKSPGKLVKPKVQLHCSALKQFCW